MKKLLFFATGLFLILAARATTVTVTSPGNTYSPSNITITQGDTIRFNITASHNVVEVSQATYNANGNTPLAGGFSLPFGGGILTGLSVGTHYFVCTPHAAVGMKGIITVNPAPIPRVWINEIHYNNTGLDTLEGIEIAGVAGTNLSCFRVYLYNGNGGAVYDSIPLSGLIDNEGCGYGALWFGVTQNTLQNGAPDALALVYVPGLGGCSGRDSLLYFISYEGTMAGIGGYANATNSVDIGVSESSSTPRGFSLQLGGVGTSYASFYWQAPIAHTNGTLNTNQFICTTPPPVSFSFTPTSAAVNEPAGTVVAGYVRASHTIVASSVNVAFRSTGSTGSLADINNFVTTPFVFAAGSNDSIPFNLTITNDALQEGTELINFRLTGASSGTSISADSIFALTINDDDATSNVSFQTASSNIGEALDSIVVTVSVNFGPPTASTVGITVTGGTATQNTDYTLSATTLNFPANFSGQKTFTVYINNDTQAEGNETINLRLANATGGLTVGTQATHTITIADDDVSVLEFYPNQFNADEFVGISNAPVRITTPSSDTVSFRVVFNAALSTATRNSDFLFNDTTLFFLPNAGGSIQVPIRIIDDLIPDGNETVVLQITNQRAGVLLSDSLFTFNIIDNDTVARGNCENLFFSEYLEGTSNNKAIEIFNPTTVTKDLSQYRLLKSTNGGTSFATQTLSGTIPPGGTFVLMNSQADAALQPRANLLNGFLNINGNDAIALLNFNDTIDIIGQLYTDPGTNGWAVDTGSTTNHVLIRNRYTYKGNVNWSSAVIEWKSYNQLMYDSLGSHHIAPCGTPAPLAPVTFTFLPASAAAAENSGTYSANVKVTNPNQQNAVVSVVLNAASSTASSITDFTFAPVNITAQPGVNNYPVTITLLNDAAVESDETVILKMQNASAPYTYGDSVFTFTIQDDDGNNQVSVVTTSGNVAENASTATFQVRINQIPASNVTVDVVFAGGSATPASDFNFTTTTLTFGPGLPDTATVTVNITDDATAEGDEVAQFLLQNPSSGITVGSGTYTLTIVDNDNIGVQELNKGICAVYPNPATGLVKVTADFQAETMELYALDGKMVWSQEFVSGQINELNLNDLARGVYTLMVKGSTTMGISKVMVR